MASDATKEQSDTIVCEENSSTQVIYGKLRHRDTMGCVERRKTSSSNSLPEGKDLSQEKHNYFFPAVKEAINVLQSTPCPFPHPLITISGEEDLQLISNSHSSFHCQHTCSSRMESLMILFIY